MARLKNKLAGLKVGQEVDFEIKNNAWKHPLGMKGIVKAVQNNRFNGMVCIEQGAISKEELIIRIESVN